MTGLPERFIEDRRLRDDARLVLIADVERMRDSLSERGIASRVSSGVASTVSSRIRAGASDALATVQDQAGEHKGLIAGFVALVIAWFAREPMLDWFGDLFGLQDEDTEEYPTDHEPDADAPAPAHTGEPQ